MRGWEEGNESKRLEQVSEGTAGVLGPEPTVSSRGYGIWVTEEGGLNILCVRVCTCTHTLGSTELLYSFAYFILTKYFTSKEKF